MNRSRLLISWLVVGVVANAIDFLVHGVMLNSYYMKLPIFRQENVLPYLIIGDFVFALVLVGVYTRVRGSFEAGAKGGAIFGFWMGLLMNFPANIMAHLMFKDFPYELAWIWTIYGVLFLVVLGAVAGAMVSAKPGATREAAV